MQTTVYLADWHLKMFEPRPNVVHRPFSTRELLTPNFKVFGKTLKNYPQNKLADCELKMLQSGQNSTFANFLIRGLLMQTFSPFGGALKNYPQNRLANGS